MAQETATKKKFTIYCHRLVTEGGTVVVEADTPDEAYDKALEALNNGDVDTAMEDGDQGSYDMEVMDDEPVKRYALKENHYYLGQGFNAGLLGMITKVSQDAAEAWSTDDRSVAEKLLPKLNLSPLAKWEVVELTT
jgi:hypothetical protein